MDETTVVIRVDASFQLGIGHVIRCLNLAKLLIQSNISVYFVCRKQEGDLIDYLEQTGFQTYAISTLQNNFRNDADETIKFLKTLDKVDYLIVDNYSLDKNWEQLLRPYVSKIMVIDDLVNREHDCDILMDQTFGRKAGDYSSLLPKHCRLLLGSEYAILSKQFSECRPSALQRRKNNNLIKNILVSMGGSDPTNVTQFIIDAIRSSNLDVELNVVLGPRFSHRNSIKNDLALNPSSKIHLFEDVNNLAELMADSCLAIGAGGTTTWERCCLGLPTLMITIADNQNSIAQQLDQQGALIYLGKTGCINAVQLIETVRHLIDRPDIVEKISNAAAKVCDGYGANRIVSELFPKIPSILNTVQLRDGIQMNKPFNLK